MKKILLGTSALALVGAFVTPAASAEWDVRVGGYMKQYVGYGNADANFTGDWDGVDVMSDSEIHFLPSITLDNGLRFGANVQLEANTSSDQIDESYMFIRGSFGEINLGSENSAGYKMSYAAPSVGGVGINSGSMSSWIPFGTDEAFRGTLGSSFLENEGNNDAQRITYYTPRFAGFQVGASYARDVKQDSSSATNTDPINSDFFDIGANYVNSFGDIDVALSGRYGIADGAKGESDPEVWLLGANLGFSGFTIGGSYGEQSKTEFSDGEVWDLGVSYVTGPWGFSVSYINGTNDTNDLVIGGDDELEQYLVAVNYKLAKGVAISAFGSYVDYNQTRSNLEDVDGFVIGTGVKLNF
jgi:outer membrane protein OmpU